MVKFAFLYCSSLPHLLIVVKFAIIQCSGVSLEDKSRLLSGFFF